jgi:light-harvesting protein B-800-850 alpha chain
MNQGRIWTVVKPTVGLPLLLGSVAVLVILVHFAILTHSTWYPAFLNGNLKKAAMIDTTTVPATPSLFTIG